MAECICPAFELMLNDEEVKNSVSTSQLEVIEVELILNGEQRPSEVAYNSAVDGLETIAGDLEGIWRKILGGFQIPS